MIYIGLGGNLPIADRPPRRILEAALEELARVRITPCRLSSFYETPAIGPGRQPPYINAVAAVRAPYMPIALLRHLHRIEAAFGRVRREKWEARVLDLDVLDWHGVRHRHRPTLPHPRMSERGFVLLPLMEIAPCWIDPISGKNIADLVRRLPLAERLQIKRLP